MRIKIIIVALVIGLVWKGGKVSDNGDSSTSVWPFFTAMLDGRIDEANRLVYEVSDSNIAIISCRYHY